EGEQAALGLPALYSTVLCGGVFRFLNRASSAVRSSAVSPRRLEHREEHVREGVDRRLLAEVFDRFAREDEDAAELGPCLGVVEKLGENPFAVVRLVGDVGEVLDR